MRIQNEKRVFHGKVFRSPTVQTVGPTGDPTSHEVLRDKEIKEEQLGRAKEVAYSHTSTVFLSRVFSRINN